MVAKFRTADIISNNVSFHTKLTQLKENNVKPLSHITKQALMDENRVKNHPYSVSPFLTRCVRFSWLSLGVLPLGPSVVRSVPSSIQWNPSCEATSFA